MGYTPQKKALKKKQAAPTIFSRVQSRWLQKWPILFFVLGFAILMLLFYVTWLSDFSQDHIQPHIVSANAKISSIILNIFGMKTTASQANLSSPSFAVSIAKGCDAMEAMALFGAALLAFPAKWKFKFAGFFAGIAILFMLNIIRVITLFLTGIYFPKAFEIMHVEVWQVLFILVALGLWIFWIKWTRREVPDAEN